MELVQSQAAIDGLKLLLDQGPFEKDWSQNACASISQDKASALDAAVSAHLESAALALVRGMLGAFSAELGSAPLQERFGRFVGAACSGSLGLQKLLAELGVGSLLEAAIRKHPGDKGVQDEVQWALLKVAGRAPLLRVLEDRDLNTSPEVVKAAFHALSTSLAHSLENEFAGEGYQGSLSGMYHRVERSRSCHWQKDAHAEVAESAPPWTQRRTLVLGALAVLQSSGKSDPDLAAKSLMMLSAGLRPVEEDEADTEADEYAALAVTHAIRAMQAQPDDRAVQASAATALADLVQGRVRACLPLRENPEAAMAWLCGTMKEHSSWEVLRSLSQVIYALAGMEGLLEALSHTSLAGHRQQKALLRAMGTHVEECSADELLRLDAVGRICTAMERSHGLAPSGVAALGRVVELLLQGAGTEKLRHAMCGTEAIVQRLSSEIGAKQPKVALYAEALMALRNISLRHEDLARTISSSAAVVQAVELALERDYWNLDFDTLWPLLAAVSLFSGLSRFLELVDDYPHAPIFNEAACGVLVDDAEHQCESEHPGSIQQSATMVSCYASRILTCLVPEAPNAEQLAKRAVALQGHVLGAIAPGTWLPLQQQQQQQPDDSMPTESKGEPSWTGPVLEVGVKSLLAVLGRFPNSAEVASEICSAFSRVASVNSPGALSVLAAHQTGEVLLAIVRRFCQKASVLGNAAVALGLLGSTQQVLELMVFAPNSYAVQLSGCQALAELQRHGKRPESTQQLEQAIALIHKAQKAFSERKYWQFQAQAELALGLLQST